MPTSQPPVEYLYLPVSNPSETRGQHVKYGYQIYGRAFLNLQPPLILLTGWTGAMVDWQDLPHFLSKDRSVITVDHRGIGSSEIIFNEHMTTHFKSPHALSSNMKRPTPSFGFDDMVHDVVALIGHLVQPVSKVDVLGWSMGGMIAQHLALTYPQLLRTLVLFGTSMGGELQQQLTTPEFYEWATKSTVGVSAAMAKGGREALVRQLTENLRFQFGANLDGERDADALLRRLVAISLESKRPFKTIMAQQNAIQKFNVERKGVDLALLRRTMREYGFRVAVVHGEADRVLPVGNAYCFKEQLPESELFVLKGEGHYMHATQAGLRQCVEILNGLGREQTLRAKL